MWLYSSEQYSVHRFSIFRSSVRHFPERSWTEVTFPCFTVVKSFTSWYALLLLFVLRSLQSHHIVLLSSFTLPFSCTSWCSCSLPCISQILQVQIVSFSILSFCRTDQEFLKWPRLTMFAKYLTGCFSHCCVEGGDHWLYVCIFVAHDGERYKPPAYHSFEGFQQMGSFSFSRSKLESCVFWLADFFQAKAEGHHQQVVITSNVCSWKT